MTTPNYPYGEPDNNGGSPTGPGNGAPDNTAYGAGPQGPAGAYPGNGYQDPYGSPQYSGGFENSPLNQGSNKVAPWALGLGIASILLYVLAFIPGIGVISILAPVAALAGLIVSIIALVKGRKFQGRARRTGFSVTGLILSILSLIIVVFLTIVVIAVMGTGVMDCFTADYPDQASQQVCVEEVLIGT
ncbi:hypothetical protein [Corynebacterium pacaense]|uniref:hypothetical protein n=1 Tax=Corynebacterium pacaense TaxID=1816684 RepID=UPI0009B96BA1|nr:hypothetical protein [Corynebacterium pacaense]